MSNIKSFSKAVGSGYIYMILTSIVGLFLSRFTLSFVTKEEFGYYTLIADILTWLSLIQLGTSSSFNVRAAQIIGREDTEELNRYTSTAIYTQFVIAVVTIIVGVILAFQLDWFLDTSQIERAVLLNTFLISVVTFGIGIFRQIYSAILIANKQIHIDNYLNIGLFAIQTILSISFLLAGLSITSLALSFLISTTIITIVNVFRVKNLPNKITISKKYFSKDILLELFGTGFWFTIGGIAGILILRIDRFFMAGYISLAVVTNFYVTSKLYEFVNRFFQSFVNNTRPYISQMHGQGNIEGLRRLYELLLNGSNIILIFICSAVYLINPWFIKLWMGNDSFYLGDDINLLIAVNFILQSAILPNRALLGSTLFKVKLHSLTRILEGLLKLILSIILVKNYGIIGLLVASIIACVLGSTIFMNYLCNLFLKNKSKRLIKNFSSYLLINILLLVYIINSLILGLAFLLFAYLLMAIFITKYISKDNKEFIYDKIPSRIKKVFFIKGS